MEEAMTRRGMLVAVMTRATVNFQSTHLRSIVSAWLSLSQKERVERQREKDLVAVKKDLEGMRRANVGMEAKVRDTLDEAREQVLRARADVADRDLRLSEAQELYAEVKRCLAVEKNARAQLEQRAEENARGTLATRTALEEKYAAVVLQLRAAV